MASGFADAHKTLEERMAANWSATPVAYENVAAKRLSDGDAPWVRMTVVEGESTQIGLGGQGSGYDRNLGLVIIQSFIREDEGGRQSRSLLDTAAAIFRGQVDNGILFRTPSLTVVGVLNSWYQVNLSVPFQWDVSL